MQIRILKLMRECTGAFYLIQPHYASPDRQPRPAPARPIHFHAVHRGSLYTLLALSAIHAPHHLLCRPLDKRCPRDKLLLPAYTRMLPDFTGDTHGNDFDPAQGKTHLALRCNDYNRRNYQHLHLHRGSKGIQRLIDSSSHPLRRFMSEPVPASLLCQKPQDSLVKSTSRA